MLLNIQHMGQTPTAKNCPAQSVNRAEAENWVDGHEHILFTVAKDWGKGQMFINEDSSNS